MPHTPSNKLRHFESLDDLFDNNTDEQVLEWVNQLAATIGKRQAYHKRRNLMQAEFARIAMKMLDEDERERVVEGVEERIEGENVTTITESKARPTG